MNVLPLQAGSVCFALQESEDTITSRLLVSIHLGAIKPIERV